MFDAFFDAFADVLNFLYVYAGHSYGGAIILLTLSVMIILTPLTLKGTRSMMRMQQLQPEMKRIQKEFKDDRQKLNEELMKFYKENSINPLGGCLPLIAQMPVFIILFHVLQGLTSDERATAGASNPCGPDVAVGVSCFTPKYLDNTSELYRDLNNTDQMLWLGFDLARSASDVLADNFVTSLPYLFMIVLVLISSYIQQKQVSGRSPASSEINQQQQLLLKIMPAFMAFISFTLQGALVLYFVVSNFWRVGQQWFIGRHIYGKDDEAGAIEVSSRDSTPDEGDDSGPKGLRGLFTGQIEATRDARENSKAAKAKKEQNGGASMPKPKPKPKPKGAAGSTNGRGGTSRTNGKPTPSAAKGASSSGQGASLPQPKPRKKKKR